MNDSDKLKCPDCGAVLERRISFDGADWRSERGERSRFDYTIDLCCPRNGCGRIFTIGRLRDEFAVCQEQELYRPYNAPGTFERRIQE